MLFIYNICPVYGSRSGLTIFVVSKNRDALDVFPVSNALVGDPSTFESLMILLGASQSATTPENVEDDKDGP